MPWLHSASSESEATIALPTRREIIGTNVGSYINLNRVS